MRTSKDPLAPLGSWKEFFFGDRTGKPKRSPRRRDRSAPGPVSIQRGWSD